MNNQKLLNVCTGRIQARISGGQNNPRDTESLPDDAAVLDNARRKDDLFLNDMFEQSLLQTVVAAGLSLQALALGEADNGDGALGACQEVDDVELDRVDEHPAGVLHVVGQSADHPLECLDRDVANLSVRSAESREDVRLDSRSRLIEQLVVVRLREHR
jgi:hypothetical protein